MVAHRQKPSVSIHACARTHVLINSRAETVCRWCISWIFENARVQTNSCTPLEGVTADCLVFKQSKMKNFELIFTHVFFLVMANTNKQTDSNHEIQGLLFGSPSMRCGDMLRISLHIQLLSKSLSAFFMLISCSLPYLLSAPLHTRPLQPRLSQDITTGNTQGGFNDIKLEQCQCSQVQVKKQPSSSG